MAYLPPGQYKWVRCVSLFRMRTRIIWAFAPEVVPLSSWFVSGIVRSGMAVNGDYMAQRKSGYDRVENDRYQTPSWVAKALCEHFDIDRRVIWEPAAGDGYLAQGLRDCGAMDVVMSDIDPPPGSGACEQGDFLSWHTTPPTVYAVVTNPPFGFQGSLAIQFARECCNLIEDGFMSAAALLLPVDFDSGRTRLDIFRDNPYFSAKIVLNHRISWVGMEPAPGEPGPSTNHCWMVWERRALKAAQTPSLLYASNPNKIKGLLPDGQKSLQI